MSRNRNFQWAVLRQPAEEVKEGEEEKVNTGRQIRRSSQKGDIGSADQWAESREGLAKNHPEGQAVHSKGTFLDGVRYRCDLEKHAKGQLTTLALTFLMCPNFATFHCLNICVEHLFCVKPLCLRVKVTFCYWAGLFPSDSLMSHTGLRTLGKGVGTVVFFLMVIRYTI